MSNRFALVAIMVIWLRSVLAVDRRSRTKSNEQKITSGRSPLYVITLIVLLMQKCSHISPLHCRNCD